MSKIRKTHSKATKFKEAMEMIKGDKTVSELCHEYGVVQSVLYRWKQTLQENGSSLFEDNRTAHSTMKLSWLKGPNIRSQKIQF